MTRKRSASFETHALAAVVSLALIGGLGACQRAVQQAPSKAAPVAINQPAYAPPDEQHPTGPVLTEAQWEALMYAVIDSIQQRSDLTQAHIEQATGFILLPTSQGNLDRISRIYGKTSEGGSYGISFSDWSEGAEQVTLGVAPPDKPESGYANRCTYDLARVKQRLEQLGFKGEEDATDLPYRAAWYFTDSKRYVYTTFYMAKQSNNEVQLCLENIAFEYGYESMNSGRKQNGNK